MSGFSGLNGVSFEYPSDWSLEEESNGVILAAPDGDSAIMIADITYEVSLFLAGHGDLESSVDALINKYADRLAGDSVKEEYEYTWNQLENGNIKANAVFTYNANQGMVDVEQIGGRVFLSVVITPAGDQAAAAETYRNLNGTFFAEGTDGALAPADLTELGFPEPPSGFNQFYSPVTGQYFIYPNDWTVINNIYDDCVMLANDQGALMLTENWTKQFEAEYYDNAGDLESCFSLFLDECAGALETRYGEYPSYSDFDLLATENQELIKAAFNYDVSEGTGRCFAELGSRMFNDKEYIQATLALYKPGDQYSIDMFSIIMDSIMIYYPTLA
jgi:hypothetical protein